MFYLNKYLLVINFDESLFFIDIFEAEVDKGEACLFRKHSDRVTVLQSQKIGGRSNFFGFRRQLLKEMSQKIGIFDILAHLEQRVRIRR